MTRYVWLAAILFLSFGLLPLGCATAQLHWGGLAFGVCILANTFFAAVSLHIWVDACNDIDGDGRSRFRSWPRS